MQHWNPLCRWVMRGGKCLTPAGTAQTLVTAVAIRADWKCDEHKRAQRGFVWRSFGFPRALFRFGAGK